MKITIFSPSGVILEGKRLRLAVKRLQQLGVEVSADSAAKSRTQRFAGSDQARVEAIMRVAQDDSDVALASRGGYGLTRLLDVIDWKRIAQSVEQGKHWVGHSDFTVFQLALLAHTGACSWAGPMALADFGQADGSEPDEITSACFMEAVSGELEAVGFRTEKGFDGLSAHGVLWGGNLSMVCSLLATRHWPQIEGGILFLEDVNERPYRVERMLLQLHQAGVLSRQKAILLGDFGKWEPTSIDKGYRLTHAVQYLRTICDTPILTGLPFGHITTKLTLPVGKPVELAVDRREVFLHWGHQHTDAHGHGQEQEQAEPVDPRALEDEETGGCCGGHCAHHLLR